MEDSPRAVTDVDDLIHQSLRDFHKARWLTLAGSIAVLCAAIITLGVLYVQQDARLRASCQLWRTLAPLPVATAPNAPRPSKLSITLVASAREAYAGQGCGHLPAADPSVTRWAPFYKIRVP